jgi:GH15 family glucan-1,4-alpha-glucosidase
VLSGQEHCSKIADYALIGDCRSAALVSNKGSIDWLCWPRFDSPSIFAAILDPHQGGHWSISPTYPFQGERAFIHHSNVLETRFLSATGKASLVDLMPAYSKQFKQAALTPDHELIRELRCTSGEIEVKVEFCPRNNYGARAVPIRTLGSLGLQMDVARGAYWLRSTMPLHVDADRAFATFSLKEGDIAHFSLTYTEESPSVLPALGKSISEAIERSVRWWQQWASRSRYDGPYQDAVLRSALALKLLAYAPSGAVVAAPSTSLPERIGAELNWDYRYCWLRDASLTIRALLGLGYFEEAESFLTWLLTATRLTQPELRVLYTVFGQIAPRERELKHLNGYFGSRPVRTGNAARQQFQLDIYGEVIEATAQYAQYLRRFDRTTQKALIGFGKYVAENWDCADEGIWEPRSGAAKHTHSRLMCWTALDRLLALADKGMLTGVPRERFTRERHRIRQQIESHAWNEALQSYVSVLDGNQVDATLLRLAWYGFEHPDSERMKSTCRRICHALGAGDSLLYRYRRDPSEGAFGVCGFWGVEQLALGSGTLQQAHHAFQQLLKYQNDVGLFAEEVDPESGNALGNFPQAFTHVGLISAALTLAEKERGEPHPAVQVGSDVKSSRAEAKV